MHPAFFLRTTGDAASSAYLQRMATSSADTRADEGIRHADGLPGETTPRSGCTSFVDVQAKPDWQRKHNGRSPLQPGDDHREQDPVVSPTNELHASTGHQRIVMPADSEESQSPLATQHGIAGDNQIRNIPMPMRQHSAGHQRLPQRKTGRRKYRRERFE